MIKTDVVGRKFASFEKTKTSHIRFIIFSLLVFIGSVYVYFFVDRLSPTITDNMTYVAFGAIAGASRSLYYMYLSMPYLFFTENKFYLDASDTEKEGYWRDVVNISEQKLSESRRVICFHMKNRSLFEIDSKYIDFKGQDITMIAEEFRRDVMGEAA